MYTDPGQGRQIDLGYRRINCNTTLCRPVTSLATEVEADVEDVEAEENQEQEVEVDQAAEQENPFSGLDSKQIAALNAIVDELGLNTEGGIQSLLNSNQHDKDLIQQLMVRLGISEDTAKNFLKDWRKAHEEAKRQKLKAKTKFKGMQALWHCSVCGRGGQPQPVCYVAPYISGYRPIPL